MKILFWVITLRQETNPIVWNIEHDTNLSCEDKVQNPLIDDKVI